MKKYLFLLCLLGFSLPLVAQSYKIGVRAGLNYFKLDGELEANETSSLTSGFHFGINGTYYFNDNFGVRAELLYIQKGGLEEHTGDNYAILNLLSGGQRIEEGTGTITLGYTLSTFSLPLVVVVNPIRKIELFAGANIDFVVGPVAQGNFDFQSKENPGDISFLQSLSYNYNSDVAGGFNTRLNPLLINVDGNTESIPKSLGAYYYFDEVEGKAFRTFDVGLTAGLSYFINPGLHLQARFDYGLLDTTEESFDYAKETINEDGTFQFRDDFDRKIGIEVSVGFRF